MKSLRLMDSHLHTFGTIDGKMSEVEVCEQTLRMGMREIAFTNHVMLTQPDYTISPETFVEHTKRIQECRDRFPELTIRLGLEMDFYDGREDEIRELIVRYEKLSGYRFDIILGAIHDLNGVFFSNRLHAERLFENADVLQLYRDYFSLATRAVKSQLFDVMAHPDLIKKWVGELSPHVPFREYQQEAEKFVDAMIALDVGMEINTKGYEQRGGEAYPTDEMIKMYLSKSKVLGNYPIITLGSDAHIVPVVSKSIIEVTTKLMEFGLDHATSFSKHERTPFYF